MKWDWNPPHNHDLISYRSIHWLTSAAEEEEEKINYSIYVVHECADLVITYSNPLKKSLMDEDGSGEKEET